MIPDVPIVNFILEMVDIPLEEPFEEEVIDEEQGEEAKKDRELENLVSDVLSAIKQMMRNVRF